MTRRREMGRGIARGVRGPWVALMVALLGVQGCQAETSYDVFVKAQQLEGEAERSACKLVFDSSQGAHMISSDEVARCLRQNEVALAEYERAGALGFNGDAYDRALLAARDRVVRLGSMVRTVTMLEREQTADSREKAQAATPGPAPLGGTKRPPPASK